MIKSMTAWCTTGSERLISRAILVFLGTFLLATDAQTKELWNTIPPSPDTGKASAEVLGAIAAGYKAFEASETLGVEARKAILRVAGIQIIDASSSMGEIVEAMKSSGIGFTVANYGDLDKSKLVVFSQWLTSQNAKVAPGTIVELYGLAAFSTKQLGERMVGWAERSDDNVFADYVRDTSLYLQAGSAGSRIFEASAQR